MPEYDWVRCRGCGRYIYVGDVIYPRFGHVHCDLPGCRIMCPARATRFGFRWIHPSEPVGFWLPWTKIFPEGE